MRFIKLLIRILFVGFFSYDAINTIGDEKMVAVLYAKKYGKTIETFKTKYSIDSLPFFLESDFVKDNSRNIIKGISYTTVIASIISVFLCN